MSVPCPSCLASSYVQDLFEVLVGPYVPPSLLSAQLYFPREKACSPVVKELQASLYTRYRCSLTVPDPSAHNQYTVSVKHLEQGKFIRSYDHSECALPLHEFPVL